MRSRHFVATLLARALVALLLGVLAALASHAGRRLTADGAIREPVWTTAFDAPNSVAAADLGPLVLFCLGRLTSWSRS